MVGWGPSHCCRCRERERKRERMGGAQGQSEQESLRKRKNHLLSFFSFGGALILALS